MLAISSFVLALAATAFAQAPEGYRTVYITSAVDTKFVVQPKSSASGSTIVVQTKADKAEQQWYIKAGKTKIQLAGSKLCLDAGAQSNWKDMAAISLKDCADDTPGQEWNLMEDGRIALDASKPQECIDLQYMRATANNPVGLYACAGLGGIGAQDKGINWPLVDVKA